ncbi:sporulation-specific protein 22, variant 3 [Mucor circinelloides]
MHQKQLTFFLEDLLPSLNATNLIDNQVFIKRIWDRSKQLDVVENDDEGRKLTQYALKLWNMTIEMIMLINTTHTQKLSIVATLKDICFNILCKNQQWKDNNSWTYLHVITALFRIWLDSDNINNIEDKLINEMKKYNAIDLNSDLPDHCIRDVIKCYIYQSEYVCILCLHGTGLVNMACKRLLILESGLNAPSSLKRPLILCLPCLQVRNVMR